MRQKDLSKLLRLGALLLSVVVFVIIALIPEGTARAGLREATRQDKAGSVEAGAAPAPTIPPTPAPVQSHPLEAGETVYPDGPDVVFRDLPHSARTAAQALRISPPRPAQTGSLTPGTQALSPQSELPSLNMPSPSHNFDGLNRATHGNSTLPDPMGDAGLDYYVQSVNTAIGVFTKGGTLSEWHTFDDLFSTASTLQCQTGNHHGNPFVIFDKTHDRWIVGDLGYSDVVNGPFYECMAVTQTSDPTGSWTLYAFATDTLYLPQDVRVALWSDSVFMSANLYDCTDAGCTSPTYQGVQAWGLKLADLVGGTLNSVHLASYLAPPYASLMPSNLKGVPPPSGTPDYYVSLDPSSDTVLDVWTFAIDWSTFPELDSGALTGPTQVTIASHTDPGGAAIPAQDGNALDSLGDRLMMQNQYANLNGAESLWLTHTIVSGSVTGLRWYELDVSGGTIDTTPVQSSTYQGSPADSTYRWLPSLAVDHAGNMAIAYNASTSSMFPEIRYAGRKPTDTANTLGQAETTLVSGGGSQTGSADWGLHSSMTVASGYDCFFWYTGEYYSATGTDWNTRIGSFRFPTCHNAAADFNGDFTSDVAIFQGGAWQFFDFDSETFTGGVWTGNPGGSCIPAAMDYNGDGKNDFTLLCGPAWHFFNDDGTYYKGLWTGIVGGVPVPADYDGDGRDDPVVFQGGAWHHFDFDAGTYDAAHSVWTGIPGGSGTPLPMDYNGDGMADPTVLSSNGAWHFFNDPGGYNKGIWIGIAGAVPVPGDYTGDGSDNVVVFDNGAWHFFDFSTGLYDGASSVYTGLPAPAGGGVPGPAPLDYNGDGKLDFTYYAGGSWYFYNANGSVLKSIWTGGSAGDLALSHRLLP